jgi:hypothetical protein
VVFETYDSTLVANDDNSAQDIFVWNATGSAIRLVSGREPLLNAATANGLSQINSLSAVDDTGRFVVFTSIAENLVTNDHNQNQDVFLRDLETGATHLVSVNASGTGSGNLGSTLPVLSANGQVVAFVSAANNLTPADTNNAQDVFVRDLASALTQVVIIPETNLVSATTDSLAISAEGRYVAFTRGRNVFLWNKQTSSASRLSQLSASGPIIFSADSRYFVFSESLVGPPSLQYYDISGATNTAVGTNTTFTTLHTAPAISSDGRYVAFRQLNIPAATSTALYVRDMVANTNIWANPDHTGSGAALPGLSNGDGPLVLSAEGRYLAFSSQATNLVESDLNNARDIFVRDLQVGRTILVSVNRAGSGPASGDSDQPYISADGRYVTFRSVATDLVAEETHGEPNLYVRDLVMGTTRLLSAARSGSAGGNSRSSMAVISANSRVVVFESFASDLAAGDFNNQQDVFYTQLGSGTGSEAGPRLQLQPFTVTGRPTLSWPVTEGMSYQVQYKNTVGDPAWLDLTGAASLGNQTATAIDNAPDLGNQRFYRVRTNP